MARSFLLFAIALFLLSHAVFGQNNSARKNTSKNATLQYVSGFFYHWNGGVYGRSGTKYRFLFKSRNSKHEIIPCKIRIGNQFFPLKISEQYINDEFNCKKTIKEKYTEFLVLIDVDKSEERFRTPDTQPKSAPEIKNNIAYDGLAAVFYTVNGKEKVLTIYHIEQRENQNYP